MTKSFQGAMLVSIGICLAKTSAAEPLFGAVAILAAIAAILASDVADKQNA